MATRFIGKNVKKRVVRPMKNTTKFQNHPNNLMIDINDTVEVAKEHKGEEASTKKENKKQKKDKEMVNEDKLTQMENIANGNSNLPKPKVKVEKGEKGLYERDENSTVLLTEDNKMLLND